jgi:hypothetical protein
MDFYQNTEVVREQYDNWPESISKCLHAICYQGQLRFPATMTDNTDPGLNDSSYPV